MDGWKSTDVTAAGRLGRPADTHQTAPPSAQGSVFMFQRRRVPINWRHLAGLDVDRVCREMDIQALQQNISNVTFCNIESEEFHGVDGNFIKLFRLAQLTIEYLLHSQQYLAEQKTQCEQQVMGLQKELEVCRSEASGRAEEVKTVKRENRKRRKIIEAYQDMLSQGATGLHPCPVCSKEFVSQQYLDSHMHRRHPDHLQHMAATASKPAPSQEEIERRLMEQMNEKFQITEQQLRQELARKETESLQSQAREFEQWKQTQQEKRKVELEEMQAPLIEKLKAVEQEKEQLQMHTAGALPAELNPSIQRKAKQTGKLKLSVKEKVLQQKQAEVEVMKRRSHAMDTDSVDFGGEVKGHVTAVTAAPTDIKRLETKVVSKWKKHKKNVHKQMQQMNKSYQDQLVEISEKLASMEQSTQPWQQTSPERKPQQQEQKKQEELMKKELRALQQKVMGQEQTLSAQKQQLVTLQSREPSPAPSASSSQKAEKAIPVESQSEVSESSEEEEEEREGEGEGEREEEMDYPDTPRFTPFPNRNTITTLFNHEQEAMEKIRRETISILDNALLQRGVTKGTVGMTDAQFDGKMKLLEAERQQRIQTHYQFMEQRQQLTREVEASATTNCQFHPPRDLLPSSPASPRRRSPQRTSPQRTSPQRQQRTSPSQSQQASVSGRVSSKPPTGLPPTLQPVMLPHGAHGDTRTARQLQTDLGDSETESGTETESDSESYVEDSQPHTATQTLGAHNQGTARRLSPQEDELSKVPAGAVRVLPASGDGGRGGRGGGGRVGGGKERGGGERGGEGNGVVGMKEDDISSWDSEDSTDHLSTRDLMSVPSSTPVQVLPVKTATCKVSKTDQASHKLETLSDNSWDVTETSSGSPPHSKRNAPPPLASSGERPLKKTATHSRSGNSQSALTTVSRGDFDDSDLSDLSTTQLT